jgi:serine/threonine protein kinase
VADLKVSLQHALGEAYRVTHELTGGGMARVFVGDELGSGRRVAIKVLPFSLTESSAVRRFRRELELAQRLRHDHIVPVLHADQTGELLYYVMPFAGDSTLRNLMDARRQLPLGEVLTLTNGIASALTMLTSRMSCIATSSPRTSCSTAAAR